MVERLLVITPKRHHAQLVHARVAGRWPGAEVVLRDPATEPVPESGMDLVGFSAVMVNQDLGVEGQTGLSWIKRLRANGDPPPIFVLTDSGDMRTAVRAIKRGADDYLTYDDLSPERIGRTLEEVLAGTLLPTLDGATVDDSDESLVEATIDATQVIPRSELNELNLPQPADDPAKDEPTIDARLAMARSAAQAALAGASTTVDKTQRLSAAELQAVRDRGQSQQPAAPARSDSDTLPDILAEQAAVTPAAAPSAATASGGHTLPEIGQDVAATVPLHQAGGIHATQPLPNHAAAVADQHAARTETNMAIPVERPARNEVDLVPARVGDVGVLHLPGREPLAVPGYRIRNMLGSGATAKVFKADRLRDNRPVVFKVLDVSDDEDPAVLRRFMREYKILREIRHPNIVRIYTRVLAPDYMCLVMEYCDGGDLGDQLASGLGPAKALRYLRDIACGLAAGHGRDIVHRDIKPGNVLFRSDGTLALGDFGAASQFGQERVTQEGTVVGTPYYVSPEVLRHEEATARSDIYSLGVLFYEMLTGERPYTARSLAELVDMHLNAPVPRLPSLVARMQPLLDKLMAKDPADRPASALSLFNAIRARVD